MQPRKLVPAERTAREVQHRLVQLSSWASGRELAPALEAAEELGQPLAEVLLCSLASELELAPALEPAEELGQVPA